MVIEIITVGDELLSGMTVNSNAAAIGAALSGLGLRVRYSTTIGDEEEDILDALKRSAGRSDIIIVTGGLGPTSDDRTRDSVARFFCTELVLDPAILADIEERFRKRGKIMADCNVRQAMIPGKVRCIWNQTGTAPGFMFRKRGMDFYVLPGVPSEMICMMENSVLPEIKKRMPRTVTQTRIVRTTGIPESELYQKLSDIEEENVILAYLPQACGVTVKISVSGSSELRRLEKLDQIERQIRDRAGRHVYGLDDETLESVVSGLLHSTGKTLSVAESCTGGMISHTLTNVPGSSSFFLQGAVTYSDHSKIDVLGVPEKTIVRFGAVSAETAKAMAKGIRSLSGSDLGISATGIAGPGGGTETKPVGLVFIGLSSSSGTLCEEHRFTFDRIANKRRTVAAALDLLRRFLLDSTDNT